MYASWSSYVSSGIGSSRACVVGRDARATSVDDVLYQSVTYDGESWSYQDYGTKFYDECTLLAANAGASIITPGTIGVGTGDGYWVSSVHQCNTYEHISGNGTSYTYNAASTNERSNQHQCMVGYMTTEP